MLAAGGTGQTVRFQNARVIPVMDNRATAATPNPAYLTGPNNDLIPSANNGGRTQTDAGYLSIPLRDPRRILTPTLLVTEDLTGLSLPQCYHWN